MEESIPWKNFASIFLNKLLGSLCEPVSCIRIDTSPSFNTFAGFGHRVECPKVEQPILSTLIIYRINIISSSMDFRRAVLGHRDV
jgi:hypothetical protein